MSLVAGLLWKASLVLKMPYMTLPEMRTLKLVNLISASHLQRTGAPLC